MQITDQSILDHYIGHPEYYSKCCQALVVMDGDEDYAQPMCNKCSKILKDNEIVEA